ncbi:uncharacterized protein LOC126355490 [Schistocerca gregaria]|uniref:uncharacterized protein LOC126355490 n=1 Tax=Schistocerca gregaria TaxID=7010 RepID=UPI00211F3446|nr:uncharacterized protein LOC126355490 [Schistocerca gregaria]
MNYEMGPGVSTLALLVLLVVAAGEALHRPGHASRHGGRVRAAHRAGKAPPGTRSKGASEEPLLVTIKAAKELEFDFGDDGTLEKEMKATGRYDPKQVLGYDLTLDNHERNRIFVTTPNVRRGIPVTLSTIPYDGEQSPRLKPYPNLEMHHTTEDSVTNCYTQLVNVVRTTKIWSDDSVLFVLDNGVLDVTTTPKQVCEPKIVVFDLLSDEPMISLFIKNAACNSYYNYLWVDDCPEDTLTAYSSDARSNVLSVTEFKTGTTKHLQSQYFHPKPGFFFTKAGGPAYYLPDGLNGLAAEERCNGRLYFQAFASNIQGFANKQVILDAKDGDVLDIKMQGDLPGELPGQSGVMAVDPKGQLLFFPVLDELAIYCWNTSKPHNPKNFRMIFQDDERLQFVSSINIDPITGGLYIMSDRLTSYLSNTTNFSEDNYQILYSDINNTECSLRYTSRWTEVRYEMGPRVSTLALLVLLLVAAGEALHRPGHASRHGGRVRAAHRAGKAPPGTRSKGASEEPLLVTIKTTKELKYDFGGNGTLEKEMKDTGRYYPKLVVSFDLTLDNHQRNRMFVTTPLAWGDIPVTLSTISYNGERSPLLKPYPNLEIHHTTEDSITDCNSQLVDVIRTTKTWADDDTLYVLDNGALDLCTTSKNVCPPKIVIFDLRTDEIIKSIVIQNPFCDSWYNNLWVDACPDGSLTAYTTDPRGNVLSVTDLTTGASKILQSQYFHPKPGYFFTKAGGPAYYLPAGLTGVTADESCDGKLYFQAFASNIQGVVDKQVIRDASDGDVLDVKTQVDLPGELSGQSGVMVVDPKGQLLFFPVLDEMAIYCWNTSKPHDPKNFRMIAQDDERLQFVSSIDIDPKTQGLYIKSNRMTSFLTNTTNYSENNFHILYIDIKNIEC